MSQIYNMLDFLIPHPCRRRRRHRRHLEFIELYSHNEDYVCNIPKLAWDFCSSAIVISNNDSGGIGKKM